MIPVSRGVGLCELSKNLNFKKSCTLSKEAYVLKKSKEKVLWFRIHLYFDDIAPLSGLQSIELQEVHKSKVHCSQENCSKKQS